MFFAIIGSLELLLVESIYYRPYDTLSASPALPCSGLYSRLWFFPLPHGIEDRIVDLADLWV